MELRKSITLPTGKTVDPVWDKKNIMVGITVTPNMILSLFENEVVDKRSIFQINEIVLITKHKKETEIPIKRVVLCANGSYLCYVKDGIKIKRSDLFLPRYRKQKY